MDEYQAKQNSYTVREQVPAGSLATVRMPVKWAVRLPNTTGDSATDYDRGVLVPGDVVKIIDYTNAGFRGIECAVEHSDGRRSYGLNAGYFRQAP